ncbi:MAG: nicotinate (nicotinamide) nucleotide adenylyltransferase [Acidobacteriaceae bacterium]
MNGVQVEHSSSDARGAAAGRPRRIAFFGGTFDPPHRGHLAIAAAAADRFHLDEVLFAPVADQPLKRAGACASFADRLAMVRLACAEDSRFRAIAIDGPRSDGRPNYTIDTLSLLRSQLPPQDELFCLIGADSFRDLPRWRDPDRLLALCEWIVVSRPGFPLQSFAAEQARRIHPLDGVHVDVSSTAIRAALAGTEKSIAEPGLIPPEVREYIREHRLYSADGTGAHGTG